MENIDSLNKKFDFFYGRGVIEFNKSPAKILEKLAKMLNSSTETPEQNDPIGITC